MKTSSSLALIGLAALALFQPAHAAERIEVLTYHHHPPFMNADQSGLSYQLVDALNQASAGQYEFELRVLPRKRLNLLLQPWLEGHCQQPAKECADNWVLPWVNPLWGFSGAEPDTAWIPLLADANRLIFHGPSPVDIKQLQGFDGLVFGGMRGHRYKGLDDLVQAGRLTRIDGNQERDNLTKVLMDRVDFTLLPESTLRYYLSQDPFLAAKADEFYWPDPPQQRYMRYAVVPGNRPALEALLERVGRELNLRWQAEQRSRVATQSLKN